MQPKKLTIKIFLFLSIQKKYRFLWGSSTESIVGYLLESKHREEREKGKGKRKRKKEKGKSPGSGANSAKERGKKEKEKEWKGGDPDRMGLYL